jgi:CBS domain-containing protein
MVVNLFLVAFNLIPAFPMDGGRVLRALLAMRIDYVKATRIAATFGQGSALVFGFVGLFLNPFLLLIALFVWLGATQESAAVESRAVLSGVPVEAAMMTDYRSLDYSDPVARAVELVLAGSQTDFPVLERGRLVGILTQRRLLEVLSREGGSAVVGHSVDEAAVTVEPMEMHQVALERMRSAGRSTVPVLVGRRPVGVLTLENVAEYLSFHQALGGRVALDWTQRRCGQVATQSQLS